MSDRPFYTEIIALNVKPGYPSSVPDALEEPMPAVAQVPYPTADTLKEIRQNFGLTLEKMAEFAGICCMHTWFRWENDERMPRFKLWARIEELRKQSIKERRHRRKKELSRARYQQVKEELANRPAPPPPPAELA